MQFHTFKNPQPIAHSTSRAKVDSWAGSWITLRMVLATAVLLSLLGLAGCETAPPVQEMSDARQAIAVARKAGAASVAAYHLQAAEEFLASAEEKLGERAYHQARRDAKQAKMKALDALNAAESAKETSE